MNATIVIDTLWTGTTARELRLSSALTKLVFVYLFTGPDRNPYGLYRLEVDAMLLRLHEREADVRRSLEQLQAVGFCWWNEATGWVWVREMARFQFALPLRAADYRCHSAKKWYRSLPLNPFLGPWFDRYAKDFHLATEPHAVERRAGPDPEAPSKGLVQPLLQPLIVRTGSFALDLSSQEVQEPVQGQLVPPDRTTVPLRGAALEEAFARLWALYSPLNGNEKKAAREYFEKLKPTPALVATIEANIRGRAHSVEWTKDGGQFVPRLVNYLKQQRWEDDVDVGPRPVVSERTARTVAAAEAFVDKHRERG